MEFLSFNFLHNLKTHVFESFFTPPRLNVLTTVTFLACNLLKIAVSDIFLTQITLKGRARARRRCKIHKKQKLKKLKSHREWANLFLPKRFSFFLNLLRKFILILNPFTLSFEVLSDGMLAHLEKMVTSEDCKWVFAEYISSSLPGSISWNIAFFFVRGFNYPNTSALPQSCIRAIVQTHSFPGQTLVVTSFDILSFLICMLQICA